MYEPIRITRNEVQLSETLNLNKLVGRKVISKKGNVVGRVKEIRLLLQKKIIEGIVVSCPDLAKSLYIGISYIDRITPDSVLLTMDPVVLLKGLVVITESGRKIGRIKQVIRRENTNEIRQLIVSSLFARPREISITQIKKIGSSIILKSSYNVPKRYFWQKA